MALTVNPPASNLEKTERKFDQTQSKWTYTSMSILLDNEEKVCLAISSTTFLAVVMIFITIILSCILAIMTFLLSKEDSVKVKYVMIHLSVS